MTILVISLILWSVFGFLNVYILKLWFKNLKPQDHCDNDIMIGFFIIGPLGTVSLTILYNFDKIMKRTHNE